MNENKYEILGKMDKDLIDNIQDIMEYNHLYGFPTLSVDDFNYLETIMGKEKPIKPIKQYKGYMVLGNMGSCGKCGRSVDYQHIYCPRCAQKLDWSAKNE